MTIMLPGHCVKLIIKFVNIILTESVKIEYFFKVSPI